MRGILTYHSVDPSGSPISIDAEAFRAHVEWLAAGGVPVVPLARILEADAPADALALTFDDAFTNFADVAWPLLRAHGFPATLFVVSDHAGATNAWGGRSADLIPTLPLMDWDAVGRAAEEGVTIGAHSRTHPDMRGLDDDALRAETEGCADAIASRTGTRPDQFAYPYGSFDEGAVRAAGMVFRLAVTTHLRALTRDDPPLRLPRLDAYYFRDPGQLQAWGSAMFRARLSIRSGLRTLRQSMQRGQ